MPRRVRDTMLPSDQTLRARPTGARREGVAITTMHSPSIANPRNSNTNESNTVIPPANR
jgi:hypothetical protein